MAKCELCGNKNAECTGFQTWQVARRETGRHRMAAWCSDKCYKLAHGTNSPLKKHCVECAGFERQHRMLQTVELKFTKNEAEFLLRHLDGDCATPNNICPKKCRNFNTPCIKINKETRAKLVKFLEKKQRKYTKNV